jgi:membrane protein DedA with SNARE-associated domain
VLGSGSLLGVAFSPYLVTHWPLTLVALSPLGRHLVLVVPVVDPVAFLAVSLGRRLIFYLACFQLGRALGPWGIPWIEERARHFGRFVRFVERLFALAPRLVVFVMAGPTVSALAGVSQMRLRVFAPLATAGLALRLLAVLGFGEWMRRYIELTLAWIEAWWLPATVVTVVAVGVYQLWRRPRAPRLPG